MNTTQIDYLEFAGNMLEKHDMKESTAPGLLDVTGISQHGMATASGLNDYDYQKLSVLSLGHKQVNQVATLNKIPIPPEVLEHFKHIKCHCMMGLFPEIGRAWLTIDSEIYIWTYEQARDVAYYDGLSHLIVSVGLVVPKAGVFIADIKYLLVLTTPTEIIVLGVTFNDATKTISSPSRTMQSTTYEEMQLMNKPIFILNTDNVAITTIEGSATGRIFLGGRDGCLYEIYYQAESSWFGKRCKKVNHSQGLVSYMMPNFLKVFSETDPVVKISIDNSRQLLYVLTEKGAIEAWDMGQDCNSMRRIARVSQNDIIYHAGNIIKTIDPSIFKPIKSICSLTIEDCNGLHLIAVTQSGVRFFFATTPLQMVPQQHQQMMMMTGPGYDAFKPQGLYLMHVRLPPGYTPNTTINKPKGVHSAHYNQGTLLLICTPQQDQDILWSISSAPFPNRPYLAESTTVLPLDGIVWSLAEVKDRSKSSLINTLRNSQRPKKIVLLTNQGAHIIALLKPADILQQLLVACRGPHHEAIKAYFQTQTDREACSTCLLLACSDTYRGTDVAMWAAQAFMLYGGEPMSHVTQMGGVGRLVQSPGVIQERNSPQMFVSTPVTARTASSIQQNLMQHVQFPTMSPISGQHFPQAGPEISNTIFSAKHDGLYLYVARLLRPVWKKRCVNTNLCSTVTEQDCTALLEDLYAIKGFLDANSVNDISVRGQFSNQNIMPSGFGSTFIQNPNLVDQRSSMEQAQNEEKRSLTALNYFIKHTCEVMALWKILCEHQFQLLANQITKEQQNVLVACTFRDLTLSRADTCAFLIVALINSYLKDNASVSSISAKLRDVCPNLYRHEDAVSFKATEILMLSKNCAIPEEKEERLRTALQLCKDAAPNLPLPNICQQFTMAGFYQGVIELSATCATKADPDCFALHYYRNNEPVDDREGYAAFTCRMNYYKEVKQMLDIVYQNICNSSSGPEPTKLPCPDPAEKNASAEIMRIVAIAIQTNDILLHVVVFDWLLAHDMLSELLALSEPSLGEFLRRSAIRNPENLQLTNLLWKYYEKNNQHAAAAKILDNLASMPSNIIPLVQRIEYLARAVMCMRNDSVGYSVHNGVLLKDLEDKLEIARVQKVILDAVSSMNTSAVVEAVQNLNYTLYDMTQLYSDFAEPFELWECKLTILNCSHHNDPLLIESVWGHILNKAVEGIGSPQEKCTKLLSKVQSLVKEFGDSGHCFPLAFIVRELEVKCCQLKLNEDTVPDALVGMNIDIELLIDYYARMISMNERVWANEGNEWHLVQSSARLVNLLARNAHQIPNRNKRRIIAKAQDLISACLNLLYPKPGTDHLTHSLREIQSKLQRIL